MIHKLWTWFLNTLFTWTCEMCTRDFPYGAQKYKLTTTWGAEIITCEECYTCLLAEGRRLDDA